MVLDNFLGGKERNLLEGERFHNIARNESEAANYKTVGAKKSFQIFGNIQNINFEVFNMGITLIKIKIMPESPDSDLNEIKEKAKKIIEKNKGERVSFYEEPIAFGLKAVIAGFEQDENKGELEPIENGLEKIKNVSSVSVIDMRRALG